MTMPIQKPGRSKQDYGTPIELIRAVEQRFGKLKVDLAATADNAKCEEWIGPLQDSLAQDWQDLIGSGIGWLNPPFADIAPWAAKCASYASTWTKIILLVPASIGSEWFAEHCERFPVIGLRPRLTFEGCKDPYPKDTMLVLYGCHRNVSRSFSTWRWK